MDPPSTTSSSPIFTKGAKGALPRSVSSAGDAEMQLAISGRVSIRTSIEIANRDTTTPAG